jgi:hypothetical protein
MKIKTKTILKTLKGEELKDPAGVLVAIGDTLGNILLASETGSKFKLYTLASKMATSDEIEVDDADLKLIKDAVESTKIYNALVAGQILQILETK